jgi:hypothetical protein
MEISLAKASLEQKIKAITFYLEARISLQEPENHMFIVKSFDEIEKIASEAVSSSSPSQLSILEKAHEYIDRAKKEATERKPYKSIILINLERAVCALEELD